MCPSASGGKNSLTIPAPPRKAAREASFAAPENEAGPAKPTTQPA